MDCGFVGLYRDWVNFLEKNRENLEMCTRTTARFKNGEHWTWAGVDKSSIFRARGHAWDRVMVPRYIDKEALQELYVGAARYCPEIEWYGELR